MTATYTNFAGALVHESRGGTERFYSPDPLGSTSALLDASGAVTDTVSYWPYGEVRSRTGSTPTKFLFVGTLGYFADSLTRLYVRARHYLADTARWLTVDPLWPEEPAYGYVGGRPVQVQDPTGNAPQRTIPPRGGIAGGIDYGAYCGSHNKRNPGLKIVPQDCIDACCQQHDRCLEAQYGAGLSGYCAHGCCDKMLDECAISVKKSGCCSQSPMPLACHHATDTIWFMFGLLGLNPVPPPGECVPQGEWGRYARINWGGEGPCRNISRPSKYGCNKSGGGASSAPGSGLGGPYQMGGRLHAGGRLID